MNRKEVAETIAADNVMPVQEIRQTPFKTHYNAYRNPEVRFEKNSGISQTIPDQSLSVSELIYRYSHGLELGGAKTPLYDSDSEINFPADWDKLDLSEKHAFMREKAEEYEALSKNYQEKQSKIAQEQREAEIERRVNEKIKNIRDSRRESPNQEENQ